ncbi:hypothetical protein T440DRAFT_514475 [Plenodomus tracheiphilus IPT5]|uniref:Uncharacterized protein n=1 Tax=Plenodomus tracheiphilus IPT5 TaxID=1408161 RepID=A0A6A7BGC3_9PLEO|nr:hypothetical protein T440DRAFT_514475 [Plenodomus tracheiphilus IPT5]
MVSKAISKTIEGMVIKTSKIVLKSNKATTLRDHGKDKSQSNGNVTRDSSKEGREDSVIELMTDSAPSHHSDIPDPVSFDEADGLGYGIKDHAIWIRDHGDSYEDIMRVFDANKLLYKQTPAPSDTWWQKHGQADVPRQSILHKEHSDHNSD